MSLSLRRVPVARLLTVGAFAGGTASLALGQTFTAESPWPADGPVPTRIVATATGVIAAPAGFSEFSRKSGSSSWSVTPVSAESQPRVSPFAGPDVVMTAIDGTILLSPKNRGIWRSGNDGATFTKGTGTGTWSGWLANFEFGAVGFAKANGQLYAFSDYEEGNVSNGHSGSWIAAGSSGVLRSADGGATWVQASSGLPAWNSDPIFGATREQNKAVGGGGNLLLTFTNFERLFRSVGAGAWQEVPARGGLPNYSTANRWIDVRGFEVLDGASTVAFVSYAGGIYRSTETGAAAGTNFVRVNSTGLPTWPEFTAWAKTAEGLFVAVSPVPSMPNPDNFADPENPIVPEPVYPLYLSTDQGATFRPFGRGLDGAQITGIAMLQDRVFVTTHNMGVLSAGICRADIAGANQSDIPDSLLTADDVITYLSRFFAHDARADIAGPNQSAGADGAFNADDVVLFLNRFFAGCE